MKKLVFALLLFSLVFSLVLLASCGAPADNGDGNNPGDNPGDNTDGSNGGSNGGSTGGNTDGNPVAEDPDYLYLTKNGVSRYVIVPASSKESGQANKVQALMKRENVEASVVTSAADIPEGMSAIILGNLGSGASQDAYDALNADGGYSVSIADSGDIILVSNPVSKMSDATTLLTSAFSAADGELRIKRADFPVTYDRVPSSGVMTWDNYSIPVAHSMDYDYIDGKYYYCHVEGGNVRISFYDHMGDIAQGALAVRVYPPVPEETAGEEETEEEYVFPYRDLNQPRLCRIDGVWYIYLTMTSIEEGSRPRVYCLKNESASPMSEFTLVGQITDSQNRLAKDGTVFEKDGQMYYVWSGLEGDYEPHGYKLFIARMSDPTTVSSERVMIADEIVSHLWERVAMDPSYIESPCPVIIGDRLFILYSANRQTTDYYLISGMYTDGDPMDADSWVRYNEPIIPYEQKSFCVGHCSVLTAEDGKTYIFYHANVNSGTGSSGHTLRIQLLSVDGNGMILPMTPAEECEIPCEITYTYVRRTDG